MNEQTTSPEQSLQPGDVPPIEPEHVGIEAMALPPPEKWTTMLKYVFSDPFRLGNAVKRRATWWLPFIIGAVIAVAFQLLVSEQIATMVEQKVRESLARSSSELSADQAERAVNVAKSVTHVTGPLFSVISVLLFALISALLWLLVGNLLLGGEAKLAPLFAGSVWLNLIVSVSMFIRLPLVLMRGTMDVPLGPAALLPEGTKGFLATVFGALDVFYIWMVIAYGIMAAAIFNWSKRKGITVGIVTYLVVMMLIGLLAQVTA